MLPSLSPQHYPVTPTAVCLGPTQPSYTGKIYRHYLQGTMGIGRQVRGLTLPQGHQPLLTPQTRAAASPPTSYMGVFWVLSRKL